MTKTVEPDGMEIVLEINDKEFVFYVTDQDHTNYINEMQPNNKVSPAHNFLMRTICVDHKDTLKTLLASSPTTLMIYAKVMEEFIPEVNITVGKSKKSQGK